MFDDSLRRETYIRLMSPLFINDLSPILTTSPPTINIDNFKKFMLFVCVRISLIEEIWQVIFNYVHNEGECDKLTVYRVCKDNN